MEEFLYFLQGGGRIDSVPALAGLTLVGTL